MNRRSAFHSSASRAWRADRVAEAGIAQHPPEPLNRHLPTATRGRCPVPRQKRLHIHSVRVLAGCRGRGCRRGHERIEQPELSRDELTKGIQSREGGESGETDGAKQASTRMVVSTVDATFSLPKSTWQT